MVYVRLVFNLSTGMRMLRTKDPEEIAAALQRCIGPSRSPTESILRIINHCLEVLELPATSGVALFVRVEVSCWGLESLLSSFECVVLLSKWIYEFGTGCPPSEGMSDSMLRGDPA